MTLFYAQPYNIDAEGFYFRDTDEYDKKAKSLKDRFGQPVEEFELQFIDGEQVDCELAKAWSISQANFRQLLSAIDEWDDEQKIRFIIAVGECGYSFEPTKVDPQDYDIDLYFEDSLKDLAIQFVDDGLFGEIPKSLQFYIDYDAIARDLAVDYVQTKIGGQQLIYRFG